MDPEETTEAAEASDIDRIRLAIARSNDEARRQFVDEFETMLQGTSRQATPEQTQVNEVLDEIETTRVARPYGSAGRTIPAALSPARYNALPAWQRSFRTPQVDLMCQRYFRALSLKDHVELRRINDESNDLCRATMAIGDLEAAVGGAFDGTVGQSVPLAVANYVNEALYRLARFRQLVRVATGSNLRVPLQTTISSSTWTAEAAALTPGEPSVSDALVLQLEKLDTLAVLTNESLEDGDAFGLVAWMINDVVMQMAETEDTALYSTGDSSGKPNGFELSDTSAGTSPAYFVPTVTQAANFALATVIDYFHIVAMFFALSEKERSQAIWTGPDTVMETLSSIVDGNGRPIFRDALAPGDVVGDAPSAAATGSIFRRPVWNLPGLEGTGQDSNRLYFMNPTRTYQILESGQIRVEASRDAGFADDTTHYRFTRRVDGGSIGNNIAGRFQYVYCGNITGAGTPA